MDYALAEGAEHVLPFDAGGEHPAGRIADVLEPIRSEECDVSVGSRFVGCEKLQVDSIGPEDSTAGSGSAFRFADECMAFRCAQLPCLIARRGGENSLPRKWFCTPHRTPG